MSLKQHIGDQCSYKVDYFVSFMIVFFLVYLKLHIASNSTDLQDTAHQHC